MGGGTGEVQKKYSRKGKLNEKNSCTPINPKKYSCYGLKKNSYKEFDNEKKIAVARKFPTPTITFLMVRPLGAISVTQWNCAAPISKAENHISDYSVSWRLEKLS